MPVLVTAAHRPLARRIASRLLAEGGEVRVFASGEVAALRAEGAFVASGTADDEGRLEAALEQVHTVVHVGGGIATPDHRTLVRDARVLARAATGAGVRRIVALSVPGASPDADDPLRRAKGEAEQVIAQVACPTIVVRVGLVDTPVVRDALVTAGFERSWLEGIEVAPVRPVDVTDLVAAFDRARATSERGHLVVAADGPWRGSLAAYLDRVGADGGGRGSLVGRRVPTPDQVERLAAALNGPWTSSDPAIPDGWAFAGLEPHPPGVG